MQCHNTEMISTEKEGLDIAANYLVDENPRGHSRVQDFYTDSTIFVTGATGFLGKLLIEKLLRTCPNLRKIYILVRPKKGKEIATRVHEIFESQCFEILRRQNSTFEEKVTAIAGDISVPDVGLNGEDKQLLMEEVNVIFHCAATVRFDDSLKVATELNIRSIRDLLVMAKQMKQLRALVQVSTAFSNCPRTEIREEIYEPRITGHKLITVCESLNDDILKEITQVLLGDWPNTYVFSKAVAEELINTEGKGLPVAIVRPSIVIATNKEPVAGWIDNVHGPTGILIGGCLGVIRSVRSKPDNVAELVPADYVVNCILAAAWDTYLAKNKANKPITTSDRSDENVNVYNYVSGPEKPITWSNFMNLAATHAIEVPTPLLVWNPCFSIRTNKLWHLLAIFFLHTIPAHVVDVLFYCIGKKTMLVKGYRKIHKLLNAIEYFSVREWKFKNDNVKSLWRKMNQKDRQLFQFSMNTFDWDVYFRTYIRGCRVYLLKDPLDTIPQGWIKYRKLQVAHYALLTILGLILFKLLSVTFGLIF